MHKQTEAKKGVRRRRKEREQKQEAEASGEKQVKKERIK